MQNYINLWGFIIMFKRFTQYLFLKSLSVFLFMFILIIGHGGTISFADIDYSGEPINITMDTGRTEAIFTFDFDVTSTSGAAVTINPNAIVVDTDVTLDDISASVTGDSTGQVTITIDDSNFINSLNANTAHSFSFLSGAIAYGSENNTSLINLEYNMPVNIIGFSVDTSNQFKTIIDYDSPVSEHEMTVILVNESDYNNVFPANHNYKEIIAGTIKQGLIIPGSISQVFPPITQSIDSTSTTLYIAPANPNTDYTALAVTESPSAGGNNVGAILFNGYTDSGHYTAKGLESITYRTGNTPNVNGDDSVLLTFTDNLVGFGYKEDYAVWIDYESDGTWDQRLDYGTTNGPDFDIIPAQTPNTAQLIFADQTEAYLENIMNATLKVEVLNKENIYPFVHSTKQSATVHIPNRIATATGVRLKNTSPALEIEPVLFDPISSYLHYVLLHSHVGIIEGTGSIVVDKKDPLSTVTTTALTDYPITATITAEEGHLTHTYELNINTNEALLEMITVNGSNLVNFSPYTNTYNIELAKGTTTLPTVVGKFDSQITPTRTINYATSGSLNDTYTVKVQVMNPELAPNTPPELEYVLNFTVPSTPDDNNSNDDNNDTNTSGGNSSSSSDKNKKSKDDSSVTSNISTNTGSLLDSIDSSVDESTDTPADSIINLIDKIETPAGARIVLDKMPETLEELMTMKASLDSLDASLKMDTDIAKLIAETERLISLLAQSKKSQQHVQNIIAPLGEYYNGMNSGSLAANQVLVGSLAMTNASIEQAGTIHLNWSDVEIEDGRVYLTPSPNDITQAVRAANQIETSMENLLNERLTPGLNSGIISTITYEIPSTLENAAQTGVVLDEETINTLTSNNVGQVDLNMGPVTFGMDNNFLSNYTGTNLEFNVANQGSMTEEETDGIPEDSSEIGAPVLDLTSFQNSTLDETFNKPIHIEFNLDYFNFTPVNGEELYIGRWNSETNTWQAVGGAYDGSKNTITTNRTHLSKYTVLKSDKKYSTLEDSWAKNEIVSLKNKGIIEDDSLFTGNENITREEFACWVSKAYGLDATKLTEDGLAIDTDSAYYEELQSLYSEVQVSGASPSHFDPSSELTKEELAVLIANALDNYDRPIDTNAFELAQYEDDLPTWAVNSVETVVENGVVDESFFGSAGSVTKEEAANILYQVYN